MSKSGIFFLLNNCIMQKAPPCSRRFCFLCLCLFQLFERFSELRAKHHHGEDHGKRIGDGLSHLLNGEVSDWLIGLLALICAAMFLAPLD